jgi:UDP-N-acetylmuramate dehydrogenase
MDIAENVSLADYSTMKLGGTARYLAKVSSEDELTGLVRWAKEHQLPFRMIGSGSNIVWRDEGFPGLILVNRLMGKQVLEQNDQSATLFIGGGEDWDGTVSWTVEQGLSGFEFLSLIPGTVGAAPVQNIGAYGGEIATVLKEIGVYDTQNECFESIPASECKFTYRDSRFKSADQGRYMITHIVAKLSKNPPAPPFYEALQRYFDEHGISEYSIAAVREAVIAIRRAKLPDPKVVANNGSFFTNPFVTQAHFDELKTKYPDIKGWPVDGGRMKLAAGWLVEKAGFKDCHDTATGMGTWPQQALVLVNEHARSTKDLLEFRQKIIFKVDELFDVSLQQEPELLP